MPRQFFSCLLREVAKHLLNRFLRLLRKRFKKLPRKVESRIASTTNLRDLETWLDNILDAKKLDDVGIPVDGLSESES